MGGELLLTFFLFEKNEGLNVPIDYGVIPLPPESRGGGTGTSVASRGSQGHWFPFQTAFLSFPGIGVIHFIGPSLLLYYTF